MSTTQNVSPPGKAKVKTLKEGQDVYCPHCRGSNILTTGNQLFEAKHVKLVWYCFSCQRDFVVFYVAEEIIGWHKSKRPRTGKR